MLCGVCGQNYGLTHTCTGIAPTSLPHESAPPPGLRFAPLHYFSEAFKILCWDDAAVRRASRDNNSLLYGFIILVIGSALPFVLMGIRNAELGYPPPTDLLVWRYTQVLVYSLVWIFLQIGLSHALAKTFFGASGSYLAIMRAYMLGQLFRWFFVVPVIGGILGGLGGIAVLMLVFEEVDGIDRMKAFGLATAIGVGFWILSIWVATNGVPPTR